MTVRTTPEVEVNTTLILASATECGDVRFLGRRGVLAASSRFSRAIRGGRCSVADFGTLIKHRKVMFSRRHPARRRDSRSSLGTLFGHHYKVGIFFRHHELQKMRRTYGSYVWVPTFVERAALSPSTYGLTARLSPARRPYLRWVTREAIGARSSRQMS